MNVPDDAGLPAWPAFFDIEFDTLTWKLVVLFW